MTEKKHFSMIRSFHLADFFTLANAFCGLAAVFCVMDWLLTRDLMQLLYACAYIPAALFFDVMDGRIARWRQAQSAMGRELDSLSDIISFGVAPAAIAFGAGMQGMWDRLILFYFVGCGVSRLARFNITAEALAQGEPTGKVKYFEGTPIPTSVFLVFMLAYATFQGRVGEQLYGGMVEFLTWEFHPLSLLFLISGSLMISKTLRIPKL
ncbi:MAG: CDP-diacylglycerol--serine O-phosphatidyltransferase [Myxococcota bacterium]